MVRIIATVIMRSALELFGGLWQLLLLAVRSRFRMNNSYWHWRRETAFGSEPRKHTTRSQRIQAMIAYGRWVHRMKRAAK